MPTKKTTEKKPIKQMHDEAKGKKPTAKKKAAAKKPTAPAKKSTPKKKPEPKRTTEKSASFKKTLPVDLTNDELLHRGDLIAQAMDEVRKAEGELAIAKEKAKGEVKKWGGIVDKMQMQLRRKKEDRSVMCHEIKFFEERLGRTYREDTGDLVSTRSLQVEELQRELALQQKETSQKKAAAKAKPGTKKKAAPASTSDKPPKGTDYASTSPAGAFAGSDKGKGITTTSEAPSKPLAPETKGKLGSSKKRGKQ